MQQWCTHCDACAAPGELATRHYTHTGAISTHTGTLNKGLPLPLVATKAHVAGLDSKVDAYQFHCHLWNT